MKLRPMSVSPCRVTRLMAAGALTDWTVTSVTVSHQELAFVARGNNCAHNVSISIHVNLLAVLSQLT